MKQSDIFTLILIASIGTVAAFFVCNTIMGDPDEAKVQFKALSSVVSKDLKTPDAEILRRSKTVVKLKRGMRKGEMRLKMVENSEVRTWRY